MSRVEVRGVRGCEKPVTYRTVVIVFGLNVLSVLHFKGDEVLCVLSFLYHQEYLC